jgi:hypothetical protein
MVTPPRSTMTGAQRAWHTKLLKGAKGHSITHLGITIAVEGSLEESMMMTYSARKRYLPPVRS